MKDAVQKNPLVSVIVPVHNTEHYLDRCIRSIQDQSYENIEILLIENGSTDASLSICKKHADKDSRIRVIHLPDGDVSQARNIGIDRAAGEILAFADSDDWMERQLLEVCVKQIEEKHYRAVFFEEYNTDAEGNTLGTRFHVFDEPTEITCCEAAKLYMLDQIGSQIHKTVFHRDCWNTVRFPEGRLYEDLATVFQTMLDREGKVLFLQNKLYHYRMNPSGISWGERPQKAFHLFLAFKEIYETSVERKELGIEGKCLAQAAKYAIGAYNNTLSFNNTEMLPYMQEVRSFLMEKRNEIIRSKYLSRYRKIMIILYLCCTPLYRVVHQIANHSRYYEAGKR